jgi:hypothetical protein
MIGRRGFMWSAAAGIGGLVVKPTVGMAAFDSGCDRLAAIVKKWNTAVRPMLASRYHRLHHCLYHYVRNTWVTLSPQQKSAITQLKWASPRPSMERATWDQNKPYGNIFWASENSSGEDFLFYHRWMIAMVDQALARAGVGPIEPWSGRDAIPPPKGGCPDEAVPDFSPVFDNAKDPNRPINVEWLQLRVKEMKTPGFFWNKMNWWGQDYRDRSYLRTTTLGELGSRLESGVHNQMHIRWSAYPSNGYTLIRDESDFREKWDDPGYDTLFDEYSSHVTPIFFRLHKWIDDRIEDWAEAHANEVVRTPTPYGFDWFKTGRWVQIDKPWTGAWGFEHVSPEEEKNRIKVMENVTRVLFPPEQAEVRFKMVEPEGQETEQRRIISLRDMVM